MPLTTPKPFRANTVNVLIVDDDKQWAVVLKAMAHMEADLVMVAGDLAEALRMAAETVFDLVLLDLTLPDAVPQVTLAAIRTLKSLGAQRVAVVTGAHLSEDLVWDVNLAGADDAISKDCRTLQACLRDVIEGKPVGKGC